MNDYDIYKLQTETFIKTKEAIQKLGGILTNIKSNLLPKNKNSEQHSLKFTASGLTTSPIPIYSENRIKLLELLLNLEQFSLQINFEEKVLKIDLEDKDIDSIIDDISNIFIDLSIIEELKSLLVAENQNMSVNNQDLRSLWSVLKKIYSDFLKFKSPIYKETSNINFWPHHFDIAMLLFSGRIISDQDPSNWSFSREQMNFGFLFGDDVIPKPYCYVTIYPFDKMIMRKELSNGAYWINKGWSGAVLELENKHFSNSSKTAIIDFFSEIWNLAPKQFYNF